MNLVVANQVPDGRRGNQNLERGDATLAVRPLQQRLTDDALEHHGELRTNLRLLPRRKNVDDAVDRLRRGICVQRGQREVTGLGDFQRGFDSFEIAHFADEHDVRIFTKRGAQRHAEAAGIAVHFALVDQTALVRMDVLDRILDGEDVVLPLDVDLVDHGGQGRRLAAARRPGDQHQSAWPLRELGNHRRKPQVVEGANLLGNESVDGARRTALTEDVAAKTGQPLDAEREVELLRLFEPLLLRIGEHAVHQLLRLGWSQFRKGQAFQLPVHADLRRRRSRDVKVRSIPLDQCLEQFWQCRHVYFTVSLTTSSIVVTPALTLQSPLCLNVIIPSSIALRRSSGPEAPTRISSRSCSLTSSTS